MIYKRSSGHTDDFVLDLYMKMEKSSAKNAKYGILRLSQNCFKSVRANMAHGVLFPICNNLYCSVIMYRILETKYFN